MALVTGGEGAPNVPCWAVSPDGKRGAFATRVRGTWNVAVIWIYCASDQAGNSDIWRLKAAGQYADLKSAGPNVGGTATGAGSAFPPPVGSAAPKGPGSAAVAPPPPNGGSQCMKDTDCKGTRICEKGQCVSPTPPHK